MKEESSCDQNYNNMGLKRFKGVVPQQNGHWGAQIYANHQRIWLGTFRSEIDAAMAYDSASINLRNNGDSHRNFPLNNHTILESKFQSHFSTEAVLNMIRDGSYPLKFVDFARNQKGPIPNAASLPPMEKDGDFTCTLLFQKELTPSDVGKLNRLVIPKRYAVKHFPSVPDNSEVGVDEAERVEEVQLEFYDREMNLWKFRYCYWKSSQSFVFTRGWNRFVKEKGLAASDTISFYLYQSRLFGKSFLVIDHVEKKDIAEDGNGNKIDQDEKVEVEDDQSNDAKSFRLFGVQIGL